jgi:hypothetical protein
VPLLNCLPVYRGLSLGLCVSAGGKGTPPGSGHRRALLAANNATAAQRRSLQTGNVATDTCNPGRGGAHWSQTATCADGTGTAAVGIDPSDSTQFIMNNGQTMPVVSFGFEIYGNDQASLLMGIALDAGVRNFFASVLVSSQAMLCRIHQSSGAWLILAERLLVIIGVEPAGRRREDRHYGGRPRRTARGDLPMRFGHAVPDFAHRRSVL